jgi:hypothetical protein
MYVLFRGTLVGQPLAISVNASCGGWLHLGRQGRLGPSCAGVTAPATLNSGEDERSAWEQNRPLRLSDVLVLHFRRSVPSPS